MVGVHPGANPSDDPEDAAALTVHAAALVDAVAAAIGPWAERCVTQRWSAWSGEPAPPGVTDAGARAGEVAHDDVVPALRALLATDVDAQRTNPLTVLRGAVVHPTRALRSLGVPPVERDADAERLFPDDDYDLTPGAFADIDPSVHEPGLAWGAAKAFVILRRRRRGR